ncbi:hypothetical protein Mterra_04061 [Calidithermus terrae]|uniref:Uncharacterized protein n=1 Tax=Calidithermus terrae TaxID=1408545 RepID=A0A399DXC5_9DEIN|nr:hypothetical protein Mterra_04061 [Calidithermus terrae]
MHLEALLAAPAGDETGDLALAGGAGGVVGRVPVVVVGHLVVVPQEDPGVRGQGHLQKGVGAVGAVDGAVVGQVHRQVAAAGETVAAVGEAQLAPAGVGGGLVDKVAQVQHRVEVFAGQVGEGPPVAAGELLAGHQPDPQQRGRLAGGGQGLGAPHGAVDPPVAEAVEVGAARLEQPREVGDAGEVVLRARLHGGPGEAGRGEGGVGGLGDLELQPLPLLPGLGGQAGPQHHPAVAGVAGGHP